MSDYVLFYSFFGNFYQVITFPLMTTKKTTKLFKKIFYDTDIDIPTFFNYKKNDLSMTKNNKSKVIQWYTRIKIGL